MQQLPPEPGVTFQVSVKESTLPADKFGFVSIDEIRNAFIESKRSMSNACHGGRMLSEHEIFEMLEHLEYWLYKRAERNLLDVLKRNGNRHGYTIPRTQTDEQRERARRQDGVANQPEPTSGLAQHREWQERNRQGRLRTLEANGGEGV